ncbi:hypothetical protein PIB30_088997 [Stylosanthes scabra]|uniref:Uncharacterized protein n=1 Tax=Stylosanthes scabra TaxID=79078 RepID=A0ABU6XT76_9FABA|nr:hypothetical protein [Stylosanthes scabra]
MKPRCQSHNWFGFLYNDTICFGKLRNSEPVARAAAGRPSDAQPQVETGTSAQIPTETGVPPQFQSDIAEIVRKAMTEGFARLSDRIDQVDTHLISQDTDLRNLWDEFRSFHGERMYVDFQEQPEDNPIKESASTLELISDAPKSFRKSGRPPASAPDRIKCWDEQSSSSLALEMLVAHDREQPYGKLKRPKVTCLLEVFFRNSSLDMILSGVAWDKKNHVWPRHEKSRLRPCGVSRLRLTWVTFGLGEKPSTKRDLRHLNLSIKILEHVTF